MITEIFEICFNLDTVIINTFIEEFNEKYSDNPITKEDFKIQYPNRNWEVDSGNLTHAGFYAEVQIKTINEKFTDLINEFVDLYNKDDL